jgi:hypothetical protein
MSALKLSLKSIITYLLIIIGFSSLRLDALTLTPGVYREYTEVTRVGDGWRVTDPGVERADARIFLPNPIFTLDNVDLSNATRVELTMHHWAGHSHTEGQQIIINGDHLLDIPINPGIGGALAPFYLNDDNPVLEVPIEWLQNGSNTFQGTIAEEFQGAHWWGQWGWYWFKLRVHVDETNLSVTNGTLTIDAPDKLIDEDSVNLSFTPDTEGLITQVQYYAKYVGFDDDGDGVIYDWHGFDDLSTASSQNVGNSIVSPFEVNWDVSWIPDQPGTISFIALIRQGTNEYRVTEPIHGYTLRRDYSVKLFRPKSWPIPLIRNGGSGATTVFVPTVYPLEDISTARIVMRSWNGQNNEEGSTPLSFNEDFEKHYNIIKGANHYYGYDNSEIPKDLLPGYSNLRDPPGSVKLVLSSQTEHHGCEVLAPGPCLLLRWEQPYPDYLSHGPPPAAGWFYGKVNWVYYFGDNIQWLWSHDLGWWYAFDLTEAEGWSYSPDLGFVWTTSDLFPWVYLHSSEVWAQFIRQEANGYIFLNPETEEEFTIPKK